MISVRRLAALGGRCLSRRNLSLLRPAVCAANTQLDSHRPRGLPSVVIYQGYVKAIHSSVVPLGRILPFDLPDVGEAIQTVEIKEWYVKPGDSVSMGDAVCEVQSDKSAVTIYVPYSGVIQELMYEVDDTATKGEPLLTIDTEDEGEADPVDTPPPTAAPQPPSSSPSPTSHQQHRESGKVLAAPAVRKMAAEQGIDLSRVVGSGKEGRVLKEDLLHHIKEEKASTPLPPPPPTIQPPIATPPTPTPAPIPTAPPHVITRPPILTQDRSEPVKGYKAVMVKTMTASGQIPQFGYCDEVDMTNLVQLRVHLKQQMEERGIKFSYMPVIIKALSMALHSYPVLNSTVDPECTALTHRADHNIGVAMDTDKGLVVPNVKQVQHKSMFEIAMELNRLHEQGLTGYLSPQDITLGTFSLSNIGAIGGTYTRPMLLPPEVAIGAFGKVQVLPRFDEDGSLKKAHVMQVSWSADHRVIDGATVTRFSNLWKSYLENPGIMIIDLK